MFKSLFIAAAASSFVCLGVVLQPHPHKPASVSLKRTHAEHLIFAEGRIEGATEEIELRPQIPGKVADCFVTEGQGVRAGDILLQIDNTHFRCAAALAEAELWEAQGHLQRLINGADQFERQEAVAQYQAAVAARDKARASWLRIERLVQPGAVSKDELEDRRSAVSILDAQAEAARARMERLVAPARDDEIKIAQARIAASQAKLDSALDQLHRTELRAPCDGQVLDVTVNRGELIASDSPNPAIILADTSRFRVRAWVDELDAMRTAVGARATITIDSRTDRPLSGRITEVSPRMSRKVMFVDEPRERVDTRTREIWIDLDTHEELILGLSVDVTIPLRPAIASITAFPEQP